MWTPKTVIPVTPGMDDARYGVHRDRAIALLVMRPIALRIALTHRPPAWWWNHPLGADMSEAARAVGSTRGAGKVRPMKPDLGDVWDAIARMENKVDDVVETIGKPGTPDNGQPASGMFAHLNAHDIRLKQFEKLWERAKGFAIGATPLLAAIWVLVGDKVLKLFH